MCDDDDLKQFPKPIPLPSWPANLRRSEGRTITLQQMQRKVALNAYRCSAPVSEYAFSMDEIREEERHENFGVFPLASLFNHSCAPNMAKVLLADWVFLRAGRDVAPGEELTQYYCDIRMPVEMRRKELSDLFGFTCGCPRCLFELKMQKDQTELWLHSWNFGLLACTAVFMALPGSFGCVCCWVSFFCSFIQGNRQEHHILLAPPIWTGSPSSDLLSPFLGEGSPTKIDKKKRVPLV